MKKLLLAVAILALLMACGNDQQAVDSAGFNFDAAGGNFTKPTAMRQGNAELASVGARYFEEARNTQGEVYYKSLGYLRPGEFITLLGGEQKDIKVENANYRIASARLSDNKVVWVSVWYILQNQQQAVVIADKEAIVYKGTGPSDLTSLLIPRGTLIGVAPPDASENPFNRRLFVAYQVPQRTGKAESFGTWGKFYIDSIAVSTKESDFKMMAELEKIRKLSPSLQGQALTNVIQLYSDSAFVRDAEAMMTGIAAGGGDRSSEQANFTAVITDDKVNVRSDPDENQNNVTGQLNKGDAVQVTSQTKAIFSVGGKDARWLYVKSATIEGWVFGSFVEGK